MPAWSVPGSQQALSPAMRRQRTRMSWMVLFSAWPRCSGAVTLGGGITIAYGSPGSVGSAWYARSSVQTRIASGSTAAGLYALDDWSGAAAAAAGAGGVLMVRSQI